MIPSPARDALAATLWSLLRDQDLDKLTVSDVARAHSITRQAFYYHFQTLDNLVKYAIDRYVEALADQIIATQDPIEAIALAFTPAVEHPATVLQFSQSKKYPLHALVTNAIMAQTSRVLLERKITRSLNFDASEITVRFYAGGFFLVLIGACQTKLRGDRVDPTWMAQHYCRLLQGQLFPPLGGGGVARDPILQNVQIHDTTASNLWAICTHPILSLHPYKKCKVPGSIPWNQGLFRHSVEKFSKIFFTNS